MDLFGDALEKTAMDKLQSARSHGFLVVSFPLKKKIFLTYAWAHKFTTTQAVHEIALDEETTSTETVIDWYNYCREVCADRIMKQHARPIGGPGTTIVNLGTGYETLGISKEGTIQSQLDVEPTVTLHNLLFLVRKLISNKLVDAFDWLS